MTDRSTIIKTLRSCPDLLKGMQEWLELYQSPNFKLENIKKICIMKATSPSTCSNLCKPLFSEHCPVLQTPIETALICYILTEILGAPIAGGQGVYWQIR